MLKIMLSLAIDDMLFDNVKINQCAINVELYHSLSDLSTLQPLLIICDQASENRPSGHI